jgi:predicted amidophosphoribosyltransferase
MSYFLAFFNLFYPRLCAGCDQALLKHEDTLCTLCLYQLSRTPFHTMENNVLVDNFYGRIPVKYATAWCYFKKGGKVQHLIHLIKYKGRKELGLYMGKLFGVDLLQSDYFKGIDVIVPVPLHPKKNTTKSIPSSAL